MVCRNGCDSRTGVALPLSRCPTGVAMPWYEFEPESKFTVKPVDDPAVDRAGMAGTLIVVGAAAFLGSAIAGIVLSSWLVAGWGFVGSIALELIGWWLMPKSQRPSAASSSAP